jgi:hypothetical protein
LGFSLAEAYTVLHPAKMNLIPLGAETWMFSFSCNKKNNSLPLKD